MLTSLLELPTCWEQLQKTKKPVVMYGMGNGADHILRHLDRLAVPVREFFASDGFGSGATAFMEKGSKSFRKSRRNTRILSSSPPLPRGMSLPWKPFSFWIGNTSCMPRTCRWQEKICLTGIFSFRICPRRRPPTAFGQTSGRGQIYRDLIAYKLTGKIKYLASTVCSRQEVFSSLLRLGPAESYVDLGAYNGDTIEEFLRYTGGRFSAVCAMEPDPKNYQKLCRRSESLGLFPGDRVRLLNLAAWDDRTELNFSSCAGRNSAVAASGRRIKADSVDNLLGKAPVTFLKMDVEGSEARGCSGRGQCHPAA